MDRKELILGNTVESWEGEVVTVTEFILKAIQQEMILIGDPPVKAYKVIPISEKWLLTAGAFKINNSMYRLGSLTFQNYTNLTFLLLGETGKLSQGYKVCLGGKYYRDIYSLHELQNLYYDLFKSDFEIKDVNL